MATPLPRARALAVLVLLALLPGAPALHRSSHCPVSMGLLRGGVPPFSPASQGRLQEGLEVRVNILWGGGFACWRCLFPWANTPCEGRRRPTNLFAAAQRDALLTCPKPRRPAFL
ncbi:hypothetical protein T484DRAFT_3544165 [Baffinella frigidus]|nr:hypothetical protein T484DRAFT_3544165 [Cryptophyta sp. CCMP2293]